MNSDKENILSISKYARMGLIGIMCIFAATFFMVERHIAFIHIELVAILVLSLFYFILTWKSFKYNKHFANILLALMGMWFCMLLSIVINVEWQLSGFRVLNNMIWLIAMPFAFFCIQHISKKESFFILSSYLLGVLVLSSIAVFRFVAIKLGYDSTYQLSSAGIIDPNVIPFIIYHHTLSIYLALGIVFCLLILKFYNTKSSLLFTSLFTILISIFTIYIVLISARIGFVVMFFLIGGYTVHFFKHLTWKWYKKLSFLVGFFSLIALLLVLTPNTSQRIKITIDEINRTDNLEKNMGENISARLLAYKVANSLLWKNPWKGVSFSKENMIYMEEYEKVFGITPNRHPYQGEPLKPHTELFRYLVILGIPIGTIFCLFYFSLFIIKKTPARIEYWMYLGVFSLYMMTDFPFHLKESFYMFCFFVSLWVLLLNLIEKETSTASSN